MFRSTHSLNSEKHRRPQPMRMLVVEDDRCALISIAEPGRDFDDGFKNRLEIKRRVYGLMTLRRARAVAVCSG